MNDMLEAIESMQHDYGRGEAYNLTRRKIVAGGGMLDVMGDGVFSQGLFGIKTFTVAKETYSFQVNLYDADTGKLLCYTQANRLDQLRTGATPRIAVKYLSNQDSATVGIIGTGSQAPTQLEAVDKVRDVKKIKAYSRNPDRRKAFAKSMSDALGIEMISSASNREAVQGSDIVVCIAATTSPMIEKDWLEAGATVVGAGPTSCRKQKVTDTTFKQAGRIFVDSTEQAPLEAGDMPSAVNRGILQ